MKKNREEESLEYSGPPVVVSEDPKQVFINGYNALVRQTGYQIVAVPAFIPRDDGTFSIVVQARVAKVPEQRMQ